MIEEYWADDSDYEPPDDPAPYGTCSECGEECYGFLVDNGVGVTARGSHITNEVDLQWVSSCCEADLEDE